MDNKGEMISETRRIRKDQGKSQPPTTNLTIQGTETGETATEGTGRE